MEDFSEVDVAASTRRINETIASNKTVIILQHSFCVSIDCRSSKGYIRYNRHNRHNRHIVLYLYLRDCPANLLPSEEHGSSPLH